MNEKKNKKSEGEYLKKHKIKAAEAPNIIIPTGRKKEKSELALGGIIS